MRVKPLIPQRDKNVSLLKSALWILHNYNIQTRSSICSVELTLVTPSSLFSSCSLSGVQEYQSVPDGIAVGCPRSANRQQQCQKIRNVMRSLRVPVMFVASSDTKMCTCFGHIPPPTAHILSFY